MNQHLPKMNVVYSLLYNYFLNKVYRHDRKRNRLSHHFFQLKHFLCINPNIYLSIYLSTCLPACLPASLPPYLPTYPSINRSVIPSIHPSMLYIFICCTVKELKFFSKIDGRRSSFRQHTVCTDQFCPEASSKQKIYSRVICDVDLFTIKYLASNRLCLSCLLRFLTANGRSISSNIC